VAQFKRVLVTGGAGCIGLQVCRELARRSIPLRLFDLPEQIQRAKIWIPKEAEVEAGSILDCSAIRDATRDCDAVIHLAAYLGVRRTELHRLRCIEINIEGTKNVLEYALQNSLRKVVFSSSSEVYGEPIDELVTEASVTQGKTVYAITKLAGEELCKAYHQRYPEFQYTILRYFNTYGICQPAQFVIPKFIHRAREGLPPIVYGDGSQIRSYCYAGDTAWATVESLVQEHTNGEVFNIANSDQPISLMDLAKLAIRVAGKEDSLTPKIEGDFSRTDRERSREVFRRVCDITKARTLLHFQPKITLEIGLRELASQQYIFPRWTGSDLDYSLDE
jgi:UDP-glucose 4-epimerase